MSRLSNLRSLVRERTPSPVARLIRKALVWKRRAEFHPYVISKQIHGESFSFCIGDATGKLWYDRSNDPPELGFLRDRMLAPDDLVFDVGSHHGLHALFMARHAARVVAIEPNPHNVRILRKNVELNGAKNVAIREAAVGESHGKISLLEDSGVGGVSSQKTEDSATVAVDLVTLDDLAREYGFPQLLKIDVEGFEDRALKGASTILARRPKIAIEVHVDWVERYGSSVTEVVRLLNLDSYCVWVLPHRSQIVAWAGEELTRYPSPKFNLFLLPNN
jgi:FkbM family methyltransferase